MARACASYQDNAGRSPHLDDSLQVLINREEVDVQPLYLLTKGGYTGWISLIKLESVRGIRALLNSARKYFSFNYNQKVSKTRNIH
jgi:hypothetical protein